MKGNRFSEEEIIGILKEAESGISVPNLFVPNLLRKHGICEGTYYRWKAKYGGLEVSDARRLKALEEENRRLKRAMAELTLDNQMLKDVAFKKMANSAAWRDAAAYFVERPLFDCGPVNEGRSGGMIYAKR